MELRYLVSAGWHNPVRAIRGANMMCKKRYLVLIATVISRITIEQSLQHGPSLLLWIFLGNRFIDITCSLTARSLVITTCAPGRRPGSENILPTLFLEVTQFVRLSGRCSEFVNFLLFIQRRKIHYTVEEAWHQLLFTWRRGFVVGPSSVEWIVGIDVIHLIPVAGKGTYVQVRVCFLLLQSITCWAFWMLVP